MSGKGDEAAFEYWERLEVETRAEMDKDVHLSYVLVLGVGGDGL